MAPPEWHLEAWISRVVRFFTVLCGDQGVLVALEAADHEGLRALLAALLPDCPTAAVVAHPGQFAQQPDHNVVVYFPHVDDAAFLQRTRPEFHLRRLRVVVWADRASLSAIREHAPDWFDWISHFVQRDLA